MADREVRVEEKPRRRSTWRAVLATVVLVGIAVGAVAFNVGGAGDSFDRISRNLGVPWATSDSATDTDGDGLPDEVEAAGWWSRRDREFFKTDPKRIDTDGDGLTDALEAGPSEGHRDSKNAYGGLSKPLESDTDGDGIGDGDEYFLDLNFRERDSDRDGLPDKSELDFGSDPTASNADHDRYSDKEEYDRGSDPMAYDLGRVQAIAAFVVGATAGDWDWGARHIGRLRQAQLESPEYLAGQIASGFVGIGDIRDIATNVGNLDFLGAVWSLVGLAPLAGDATKTVAILTEFAERGDRAKVAALAVVERLPWSKSTKQKVVRKIFGSTVKLPASLTGGKKDYVVYRGHGYVGITNDFGRRKAEHAAVGRSFVPEPITGATGLSQGEARAIEETCIFLGGMKRDGGLLENQRHSISPATPYYDDAITWGKARLHKIGGTCQLKAA